MQIRDELFQAVVTILKSVARHRGCEDGFYACPKSPDHFGHEGDPCDCYGEDAAALLKELGIE